VNPSTGAVVRNETRGGDSRYKIYNRPVATSRVKSDRKPNSGFNSNVDNNAFLTKNEYVTRWLRELVVSGEMEPGARVRQQQIAEMLGVSATPVREAIRQLQTEGYFTSAPHKGARVADLYREGLDEVYTLRAKLEGYLAREATARMTPQNLRELKKLSDDLRAVVKGRSKNRVEVRRLNYRLHRLFWEVADQPLTLAIVNSLWGKFPILIGDMPGRDMQSVREHEVLLAAIEAGDADAAEKAIVEHVEGGRRDYHRLRLDSSRQAADH
jgi:DNA-binding GntR family transcriptional regulator